MIDKIKQKNKKQIKANSNKLLRKKTPSKLFLAIVASLSISFSYPVLASSSSFDKAMESAFGAMSNTTSPKAYMGAKRGVVTGGQLFIKNQVKRVNLFSATAPSFSAGCGGINLYGGSLSFINADQMIETFQAIGSNAAGYGLKIAISSLCEKCESVMTSLEKTAQAINKMNIDSCEAAQGIVDATVDYATGAQAEVDTANKETKKGYFSDFSDAWSSDNTKGKSASKTSKENDSAAYAKDITGNLTWRAMVAANLKNSFLSGDNDLLEVFQTMVGTVIVTDGIDSSATDEEKNQATPSLETRAGHGISLTQLVSGTDSGGSPFMVYKCDTYEEDGCLKLSDKPDKEINNVEGMSARMKRILIGDDGNGGIVKAFETDEEWSNEAKDFLNITTPMAQLCLRHIRQASSLGESEIAVHIGEICSERMALESSYSMINDYIESIYLTVITSKSKNKEDALKVIKESKDSYDDEYAKLSDMASSELIIANLNIISEGLKARHQIK